MRRIDYINDQEWANILDFSKDLPTPCLVVNLDVIRRKYHELAKHFSYAKIYYAVKANPGVPIIELLRDLGSNFDISSIYELDRVLSLGVSPDRLSYGNTIKKRDAIKYAYDKGVRLFATDSLSDLQNLAKFAPGSKVFVRIMVGGESTSDWPLSDKFGCHHKMAYQLMVEAQLLGLEPYGISFHVGSQQRDIGQWDDAISKVKHLFTTLEREKGIQLKMINMGGGFPAKYMHKTHDLSVYATDITRYIQQDFGNQFPEIIVEPGRAMVAEAGVLISEIVLTSRKGHKTACRWVYADAGRFNGLIETLDEAIKYPVFTEKDGGEINGNGEEVILAGPTCDSMDIMYQDYKYKLPRNMEIGDRLYWFSTGAYTASYCSVEFNGFPPMKTYFRDQAS
jgi:ornithine decarboxylase